MSETLTRLALALAAASLCTAAASAQTTLEWIVLSPAGEGFTARMPKQPVSTTERVEGGGLSASGRRYAAEGAGRATLAVWSLKYEGGAAENDLNVSRYLDQLAELAWGLIVKPELSRLEEGSPEWRRAYTGMSYRREIDRDGHSARAYFVNLAGRQGAVYVFAAGPRIYVVSALAADARSPQLKQFTDSFALAGSEKPGLPSPASLFVGSGGSAAPGVELVARPSATPDPTLPPPPLILANPSPGKAPPSDVPVGIRGDGSRADYDRPFRSNEVTKKAAITFKPEPDFTEGARKFSVTGVVRIRAILTKTGKLTNIAVVKGLPHGLTEKAIAAARQIRFEPAQKDGRAVSQYVVLEYNYNIY
jgi:TonB family protein